MLTAGLDGAPILVCSGQRTCVRECTCLTFVLHAQLVLESFHTVVPSRLAASELSTTLAAWEEWSCDQHVSVEGKRYVRGSVCDVEGEWRRCAACVTEDEVGERCNVGLLCPGCANIPVVFLGVRLAQTSSDFDAFYPYCNRRECYLKSVLKTPT